jgi:hypothetical protein
LALPRPRHNIVDRRAAEQSDELRGEQSFDYLVGAQQGCLLECSYALAFFDLDLLLLLRRLRWTPARAYCVLRN